MLCSLSVTSSRRHARCCGLEAEIRIDFPHHFLRAQIAGQEHQAFFEIHRPSCRPAAARRGPARQAAAASKTAPLFRFHRTTPAKARSGRWSRTSASAATASAAFRDGPDTREARRSVWPPHAPSEIRRSRSLSRFFELPCSASASASTVRVFPVPVGPSRRNTPTGLFSGASPA